MSSSFHTSRAQQTLLKNPKALRQLNTDLEGPQPNAPRQFSQPLSPQPSSPPPQPYAPSPNQLRSLRSDPRQPTPSQLQTPQSQPPTPPAWRDQPQAQAQAPLWRDQPQAQPIPAWHTSPPPHQQTQARAQDLTRSLDEAGHMQSAEGFFDKTSGKTVIIAGNVVPRAGETPGAALCRVVLHERVGHDGLHVLLDSNQVIKKRWDELRASIPQAELDAIGSEEGYTSLAGDPHALALEWFAHKAESDMSLLEKQPQLKQMWDSLRQVVVDLMARAGYDRLSGKELDTQVREMMQRARGAALKKGTEHRQLETPRQSAGGKLFSLNAARRQATSFGQAESEATHFLGKPLTNLETGLVAVVSRSTLGKMLSQKAAAKSSTPEDHARAVANVDSLFETAVLDHSHPDSRGEPTILGIHRYVAPMLSSGGEVLAVKMTVKETASSKNPNPLYTVEVIDIEIVKPALGAPQSGIERGTGVTRPPPQAGFSQKVREMLEKVKSEQPAAHSNPAALKSAPKAEPNASPLKIDSPPPGEASAASTLTQSPQDLYSILSEDARHGGIEALRREDPIYMKRWENFVKEPLQDREIQRDLASIRQEPAYRHLNDNEGTLVNEWFSRQVEKLTPAQLASIPDNTWLGIMWRQFHQSAQLQAQDAGAPPLTDTQLRELAVRSREAHRRAPSSQQRV